MNKGISLIALVLTIMCIVVLASIVLSTSEEEYYMEEKIYCPTCGQKLKSE